MQNISLVRIFTISLMQLYIMVLRTILLV
uniref:Uncharacterized protein n=1 Tax=Arundo donax TaxID=35708 RepID=A0A0A9HXP6_ARUDO